MATVLVTGGGGFVGANLVRRLLATGERVVATVRPGGDPWRLVGADGALDVVSVDLCDSDAVDRVVGNVGPERVFHLATHGAYSWQTDVDSIVCTNIVGTSNLLESCAAARVRTLVHTGSSSEYGFKRHPASEDEVLEPNGPYGVAKAAATQLCCAATRAGKLHTSTLRLYSAYGPFEDPNRLVPQLLTHARRGRLPPLVAPEIARDFVYVSDVVDALLLAAEHAAPGRIYNVASGRQSTLREIVELVRGLCGPTEEPQWGARKGHSWDTDVWVGNAARIRAELGWRPRHDLSAGLRATGEWLEHAGDVERYDLLPVSRKHP